MTPSDISSPCAKCATPDMCKKLGCADAILIAQEARGNRALRMLFEHWDEYGPENGFGELMRGLQPTVSEALGDYPPLPTNIGHVLRRIRRCENEVAAQVVLEYAMRAYGHACMPTWVRITDRLPELGQSVALIHEDNYENTGGDLEMNVRACGYFSQMGSVRFWSIRGERATSLDAFTHWLALPASPIQGATP